MLLLSIFGISALLAALYNKSWSQRIP